MSTNLTTQRDIVAPSVGFGTSGIELKSLDEAFRFAKAVKDSGLAPAAYKDATAILVVMQIGMELGYTPMQALRNMWPGPDGKPNEYVESSWARVLASGLVEDWSEEVTDKVATFRVVRKGSKTPVVSTFTIEQAIRASLIKDGGNWKKYPERMLKARAKGYAIKDAFPDVLRGMSIAEATDEFFRGSDRARDITPPKQPDPLLEKLGLAAEADPFDGSSQQAQDVRHDATPPQGAPAGELSESVTGEGVGADSEPTPAAYPAWDIGSPRKIGKAIIGLQRPHTGDVQYFATPSEWCAALCELGDLDPDHTAVWDMNSNVHAALVRNFPQDAGHMQAALDHFRLLKTGDEADKYARAP